MKINFIDLQKQYQAYKKDIDNAINAVLNSSRYVFGEQISELEEKLADFVDIKYAAACGSGTDALILALMALDIKSDDEIITTPFTFIATAEAPALLGAKPVFADVNSKTYNIDAKNIEQLINPKTKCIIPVSLFGQVADMEAISEIAEKHGVYVIEDAAQSFGSTRNGKKSCSFGDIGITSFFPAKPLGCYGEGGMVFTDNEELYNKIVSIRNHGQSQKYEHGVIGLNARLDTIQAAVLLAKFKHYENEIELRNQAADYYNAKLKDHVTIPYVEKENTSVYAQYSIRVKNRVQMAEKFEKNKIPFAIHYPKPLHLQPCFSHLLYSEGDFPVAESISKNIMSLPMYPQITREEQDLIINTILS